MSVLRLVTSVDIARSCRPLSNRGSSGLAKWCEDFITGVPEHRGGWLELREDSLPNDVNITTCDTRHMPALSRATTNKGKRL